MAETTVAKSSDLVEAAGLPVGSGEIKPGYDPRLTNEDLAPCSAPTCPPSSAA